MLQEGGTAPALRAADELPRPGHEIEVGRAVVTEGRAARGFRDTGGEREPERREAARDRVVDDPVGDLRARAAAERAVRRDDRVGELVLAVVEGAAARDAPDPGTSSETLATSERAWKRPSEIAAGFH